MKNATNNKIKLGVFVTVGVVLFIGIVYFIGQRQQLFSSTFKISGVFANVSGLRIGNNVRFAGITVGTVDNIEIISDTTVRVDLIIEKKSKRFIKKDSRIIIGSDGLMGSKVVNIVSGTATSEEIKNDAFVKTDTPVSFDDIMVNMKTVSDNAIVITKDLSVILESVKDGKGTIGKLFMDPTLANNLNSTIANAKTGVGGFSDNMEALKHNFLLKGYYKKQAQEAQDKKDRDERVKNGTATKKDMKIIEEEDKAKADSIDAKKKGKKNK